MRSKARGTMPCCSGSISEAEEVPIVWVLPEPVWPYAIIEPL
jgi:hypothetical protein